MFSCKYLCSVIIKTKNKKNKKIRKQKKKSLVRGQKCTNYLKKKYDVIIKTYKHTNK